jgi:hypothetical protein
MRLLGKEGAMDKLFPVDDPAFREAAMAAFRAFDNVARTCLGVIAFWLGIPLSCVQDSLRLSLSVLYCGLA